MKRRRCEKSPEEASHSMLPRLQRVPSLGGAKTKFIPCLGPLPASASCVTCHSCASLAFISLFAPWWSMTNHLVTRPAAVSPALYITTVFFFIAHRVRLQYKQYKTRFNREFSRDSSSACFALKTYFNPKFSGLPPAVTLSGPCQRDVASQQNLQKVVVKSAQPKYPSAADMIARALMMRMMYKK